MLAKVIGTAMVGVFVVAALRQVKPELAILGGLAASAIIIFLVVEEVNAIISTFQGVSDGAGSGLGNGMFKTIVKIIGTGYVTEYAASICEDYGTASLGKKIQLAGKVSIFTLSLPIILNLVEAIGALA